MLVLLGGPSVSHSRSMLARQSKSSSSRRNCSELDHVFARHSVSRHERLVQQYTLPLDTRVVRCVVSETTSFTRSSFGEAENLEFSQLVVDGPSH
jgi:hypothetical protein